MRSWRRGTKEMDLILGRFADAALDSLSPRRLAAYENLLSENDQDLYLWIAGAATPPESLREIVEELRSFHAM
jgi:antitoxin CptB